MTRNRFKYAKINIVLNIIYVLVIMFYLRFYLRTRRDPVRKFRVLETRSLHSVKSDAAGSRCIKEYTETVRPSCLETRVPGGNYVCALVQSPKIFL